MNLPEKLLLIPKREALVIYALSTTVLILVVVFGKSADRAGLCLLADLALAVGLYTLRCGRVERDILRAVALLFAATLVMTLVFFFIDYL